MKLLVAALALATFGCVDDSTTGGGQGDGIMAEKMSGPNGGLESIVPADFFTPGELTKPYDRSMAESLITRHFIVTDAPCKNPHQCRIVEEDFGGVVERTLLWDQAPVCKVVFDAGAMIYTDC